MAKDVHPRFPSTNRFELRDVLGVGGMGVVYEAFDRERDRKVALKTLLSLTLDNLRRFKNEFRSLQDIEHRNLVRLDELIEADGAWFFTMELVDGVDFLSYVRPPAVAAAAAAAAAPSSSIAPSSGLDVATATGRGLQAVGGPGGVAAIERTFETGGAGVLFPVAAPRLGAHFDEPRLRDALAQLARGLAALHAVGKVHRDVKPGNVMVTRDDRVVILDFGLISDAGKPDERVGTVAYMAPEQAGGGEVGPAADWYAVGVTLFRALTGGFPFSGTPDEVMRHKQVRDASPPSSFVPGIPADLDRLCLDLLRRLPEQRPGDRDVLAALGLNAALDAPAAPTQAFVGRGAELAALDLAFAAAAQAGCVALVHGESGVGKSALLRRFVARLDARGDATTLVSRCYERETVPYKAVDQLMDVLARRLAALEPEAARALLPVDIALLAGVFPALVQAPVVLAATRSAAPPRVSDPFAQRTAAFAALRELLAALAGRERLVLAIDDLQWADQDSLALLADLMAAPAPPILLCATVRTSAGAARSVASLADRLGPDVRLVDVGALPPDDARELVRRLAGSVPGGERVHADDVAGEAGGHPMLIDALVRHRLEHPDSPGPMRLDEAIVERTDDLDPATRRVLAFVCVAGGPVQQEACAHAAGIPFGELAQRLTSLRAANLVRTHGVRRADDVEPYHDRVREAVVARLADDERREIHGRLARALEAGGGDPETLAVHFLEAGDPRRAGRYAARAADRAYEALAFDRACRLYRLALDLEPGGAAAAHRLRLRLAEALGYVGRCVEAAETYVAAAAGASLDDELELRRLAAGQYVRAGRIGEGLDVADVVLKTIGLKVPRKHGAAMRSFVWQLLRLRLRGLKFTPRDEASAPPDLIHKTQILFSLMPFGMTDTVRGHAFQMYHLRLALASGVPARIARALMPHVIFTASSGGEKAAAEVDRMLALGERLAAEASDPYLNGFIGGTAGAAHSVLGRWAAGRDRCEEAAAILRAHCVGVSWETATTTMFGLRARFFLGEVAEIRRRMAPALKEATERGDLYLSSHLRVGLPIALVCLADGDPARARRLADEALRDWSYPGIHLQHVYALIGRILADLYEGDPVAAQARLDRDLPAIQKSLFRRLEMPRVLFDHQRGSVALLAAARATGSERAAHLAAARGHLRRLVANQVQWATGLTRALEAGIANLAGTPEPALAALAVAEEALRVREMTLFAMAVRRQRGRLMGGDEGDALVASADRWMTAQAIRDPARLADTFVPGFDPDADAARRRALP